MDRRWLPSLLLALTLASCGSHVPNPSSAPDPDAPFPTLSGLSNDPDAAREDVRARLVAAWKPVLTGTPSYLWAHFGVDEHSEGSGWWDATITVSFGSPAQQEWPGIETQVAQAARDAGWTQAGVSHGLNVRQSTFRLSGGCSVSTGCKYSISTSASLTHISGVPGGFDPDVPELATFRRSA